MSIAVAGPTSSLTGGFWQGKVTAAVPAGPINGLTGGFWRSVPSDGSAKTTSTEGTRLGSNAGPDLSTDEGTRLGSEGLI
ncbi:MAG TPA: hypothetical protein VMW24_19265 [Sedimentisphaerales bacterium]|nr:hypothetical protein [Sedimentisphaerales bacterium]